MSAEEGDAFERAVDREIGKLVDRGAFSVDVRYEMAVVAHCGGSVVISENRRMVRLSFLAWARENLLDPKPKGWGEVGSAKLIVRGERVTVEVCRPSNHGYPSGVGFDYPLRNGSFFDALRFFEGKYVFSVSLGQTGPHTSWEPAPMPARFVNGGAR